MTVTEKLKELYTTRTERAKELKEKGQQVVGYFCCFVPEEIITAFDLVPFRLQGSQKDPIDQADAFIEPMACPFARSCFNRALKGEYDFLDGFVAPHSCDTIERLYHIWFHNHPAAFNHLINVPHMRERGAEEFFRAELHYFARCLEDWTGRKLDREKLREAVCLSNRKRVLLRDLYELRKRKTPPLSGVEVLEIQVAGMGLPVEEYVDLLEQYLREVRSRNEKEVRPRIFLWGNVIDDSTFIRLIEDSGAWVVMDDLCTGSRSFWEDVPETADPFEGLARRYLNIPCPRSNFPRTGNRPFDLASRFGYIGDFVRDWQAEGAIFYVVRYCDTCELEAPDLRDYLREMGMAVLMLEDDYSLVTIGQLRTRVQAFIEMMTGVA
ncbi:MAG TPA: 2-hydroxyacyl-CoA dehydratase family protein [Syntrophales bacterium]|nr:2-hydroxyacyl-CoA dehydratase family protein [Syntrophales bacterium]HOL59441.1 2-hydroxyacyl-CoA dehydratase family protein [Syntrophales bacterium]HPO34622.1 2-hydroxyacyl-CoA dehydratase family protein [Syntrophales bacterium]